MTGLYHHQTAILTLIEQHIRDSQVPKIAVRATPEDELGMTVRFLGPEISGKFGLTTTQNTTEAVEVFTESVVREMRSAAAKAYNLVDPDQERDRVIRALAYAGLLTPQIQQIVDPS